MSKPVVYIELGFLASYFKERCRPYSEIMEPMQILFINVLIDRSRLYYCIPESDIEMILKPESDIEMILEKKLSNHELFNEEVIKFIQFNLSGVNSFPYSCYDELNLCKNGKASELKDSCRPNFILLDANAEEAKKVHDITGIICLPKLGEKSYLKSILQTIVKPIVGNRKLQSISLKEMLGEITSCHSMIIEDPFIYQNFVTNKKQLIEELLRAIIHKEFTNKPFNIVFVLERPYEKRYQEGNVKYQKRISEYEQFKYYLNNDLQQYFNNISNNIINMRLVFKELDTMHDRHIISNSFWITCGFGFSSYYRKTTKWTCYPVGIHFDEIVEHIVALIGEEEKFSSEIKGRFFKLDK